MELETFEAGDHLYTVADNAEKMYLIQSGRVDIRTEIE
jgi:CRP-like cAMP-binding protein